MASSATEIAAGLERTTLDLALLAARSVVQP